MAPGIALHKKAVFILLPVFFGALHDGIVHQFNGGRLMLQCNQVSKQGFFQCFKVSTNNVLYTLEEAG